MSKRIQRRLKKALAEQRGYEEELARLQDAADPNKRCKELIDFLNQKSEDGDGLAEDPMLAADNPFKLGGDSCCALM